MTNLFAASAKFIESRHKEKRFPFRNVAIVLHPYKNKSLFAFDNQEFLPLINGLRDTWTNNDKRCKNGEENESILYNNGQRTILMLLLERCDVTRMEEKLAVSGLGTFL